jgi:Domain of unknown function (DUF1707)
MDETRHALPVDSRRASLRVSDADRDAVVTELGEHFQQGRLDRAEFDERLTQALAARTEGDLDALLADLPPVPAPISVRATAPRRQPPRAAERRQPPRAVERSWPGRLPLAVPLLVAVILITTFAAGGWQHGWVPWPLWWLLPIMIMRFVWWRGAWRRRPWP